MTPQDLRMWGAMGIKWATIKQVEIGTWTGDPVCPTMWKTVYEFESQQLNRGPYGSSCPSKAGERKINTFYMISLGKDSSSPCRHCSALAVRLCVQVWLNVWIYMCVQESLPVHPFWLMWHIQVCLFNTAFTQRKAEPQEGRHGGEPGLNEKHDTKERVRDKGGERGAD